MPARQAKLCGGMFRGNGDTDGLFEITSNFIRFCYFWKKSLGWFIGVKKSLIN